MKAGYEKGLNQVTLHIDIPLLYEEDYQMHMLRENRIPGLLPVTGCGMDGKSRYDFDVTGMTTMKKMFEHTTMRQKDMLVFVNRLIQVVKELQRYMLQSDRLMLYPEFLFYDENTWYFCYLPKRKKSLCEAFHVLTEYFVRKLDYEDTEGIMLAYEIHKATLQENYDLEKIMAEYKDHEEKRSGKRIQEETWQEPFVSDENVFSLEQEYEQVSDVETIRELGGRWNPWKKTAEKLRKTRWGNWKDLILETDGQEKE